MKQSSRVFVLVGLVIGTAGAFSACGNPDTNLPPTPAGTGGDSSTGGGVSEAGGTGGGNSGSTGGSMSSTSGGATATGGTGGGGPVTCSYTPEANAGDVSLTFAEIMLPSEIPVAQGGKNQDGTGWGGDGFVEIQFIPGSTNEALLLQNRGRVNHISIPEDGTSATLIKQFDLPQVHYVKDCGLISMAFDPDFKTNSLVYFGHCDTQDTSKISRYTFTGAEFTDRQDIMTWTRTSGTNEWHTVGAIGFDSEKNLWVLHGEFTGGAVAQDLDSNLGKLLRMVPNRTAGMGGYEPAAGNPYINDPKPKSAIWGYGFRSAWRGFTNSHGHIVMGDVGPGVNEEINVITEGGKNYGWDGSVTGPCQSPCVSPIIFWRGCGALPGCMDTTYRAEGNNVTGARAGRAVWVGTEYGNCGNDRYNGALTGVTLFGDFFTGWVRGAVIDATGKKVDGSDKSLGHLTVVTSWAQAPDGYLYVTTYGGPYDSATSANDKNALWRAVAVQP